MPLVRLALLLYAPLLAFGPSRWQAAAERVAPRLGLSGPVNTATLAHLLERTQLLQDGSDERLAMQARAELTVMAGQLSTAMEAGELSPGQLERLGHLHRVKDALPGLARKDFEDRAADYAAKKGLDLTALMDRMGRALAAGQPSVDPPFVPDAAKENPAPLRAPLTTGRLNLLPGAARKGRHAEVLAAVADLVVPLESSLDRGGFCLTQASCRGASGTLQGLLRKRFGIETKSVASNKLSHTYLMIERFFPSGEPLIIDPSYRQFLPKAAHDKAPKVFVGTRQELRDLLAAHGVPGEFGLRYFDDERPDPEVPDLSGRAFR